MICDVYVALHMLELLRNGTGRHLFFVCILGFCSWLVYYFHYFGAYLLALSLALGGIYFLSAGWAFVLGCLLIILIVLGACLVLSLALVDQ